MGGAEAHTGGSVANTGLEMRDKIYTLNELQSAEEGAARPSKTDGRAMPLFIFSQEIRRFLISEKWRLIPE